MRQRLTAFLVVALLALVLGGCGPEVARARGGGPGGDVGNRSDTVQLHGDTPGAQRMFQGTPLHTPVAATADR